MFKSTAWLKKEDSDLNVKLLGYQFVHMGISSDSESRAAVLLQVKVTKSDV